MKAIQIDQTGLPDVIKVAECSIPIPGVNEALVLVKAAGVNFIDIYIRQGRYPKPLPHTLGLEGAGIVIAVGSQVTLVKTGDRVAWTDIPGSYATHIMANPERLVPLPSELSFEQGAAAMLQGLTAHYLSHGAYWIKKGDTCLVHAAAGGVGLLLSQIAKLLGAHVIGTVSTPKKAELAYANEIILYTQQDFLTEVKRLTTDRGVTVVYDSVGKDTFEKSLECLSVRGTLVSFGQSSGPVAPFDIQKLAAKSLFLTRPSLFHYVSARNELLRRAQTVFQWIITSQLKLSIDYIYKLEQAADAHRDLEGRKTTGKVLLIPS